MSNSYVIKKTNILLAETVRYSDIDLNSKLLICESSGKKVQIRKVLFLDKHFFDMRTGDEIFLINRDESGLIIPEVYANTTYIIELYKDPNVIESDLVKAMHIYENFLKKEALVAEKKLINFPQRRLY